MGLIHSMDGRIPADIATDYWRHVIDWLESPQGQRYLDQSITNSLGLNPRTIHVGAGRPVDAVRVITLRRRAAEAVREAKDAQRHLPHRFIVRGHWRNQVCGPNRSERKLRWIAPFVKGPDDGEFMSGEKLYRLER